MKQIKTIKHPLKASATFDEEVNAAMSEGWQLTKREVLGPMSTSDPLINTYVMLYAELEREIIVEAERCCENCKYFDQQPESEPCLSCEDGLLQGWEPAT